MNFFYHKDLGNHLLQLCPKVVKHLYVKIQLVPRSKHTVLVIKTSQLMLYREIIVVYSHPHTHTHTQNT